MASHIILVGPMGAGKTTIGKLLSEKLDLPFKDVDHLIVEQAGVGIPWIFDVEGEAGFRKREAQVLEQVLQGETAVIATGGGVVTQQASRDLLSKQDCVVFLYAPVELQLQRTMRDKNRPLLQQANPKQVLHDLMQQREPWYRELANITVETGKQKPQAIVDAILQRLYNK